MYVLLRRDMRKDHCPKGPQVTSQILANGDTTEMIDKLSCEGTAQGSTPAHMLGKSM